MSDARPSWAVRIEPKRGQRDAAGRPLQPSYIYVRAATVAGAIRTARANNFNPRYVVTARAHIATPEELGCVPTPQR